MSTPQMICPGSLMCFRWRELDLLCFWWLFTSHLRGCLSSQNGYWTPRGVFSLELVLREWWGLNFLRSACSVGRRLCPLWTWTEVIFEQRWWPTTQAISHLSDQTWVPFAGFEKHFFVEIVLLPPVLLFQNTEWQVSHNQWIPINDKRQENVWMGDS